MDELEKSRDESGHPKAVEAEDATRCTFLDPRRLILPPFAPAVLASSRLAAKPPVCPVTSAFSANHL